MLSAWTWMEITDSQVLYYTFLQTPIPMSLKCLNAQLEPQFHLPRGLRSNQKLDAILILQPWSAFQPPKFQRIILRSVSGE